MGARAEGEAEARYRAVMAAVAEACRASGRDPAAVTVLAISKRHPDEAVRALAALGHRDFGENLVQPWLRRLETLTDLGLRWHLVGPVQTNKAKHVARGRPALLHTVDREPLVEALEARLAGAPPLDVLVQVNVDDEPQKAGCAPEDLDALADRVAASPALTLRGLMAIPRPPDEAPPRPAYARLRALSEAVADRIAGPPVLSMGMSADFADAIAEGATLVRIGTALFGERPA